MRLYSTSSSYEQREVTLLAIVETLAASLASLYIAARIGTVILIAISAVVAPLLLLSTRKSMIIGIVIWKRTFNWWAKHERLTQFTFPMFWLPLVVRVLATGLALIRYPLLSIGAIPSNWTQIAFCLDSFRPPEPIPGYGRFGFDDILKPVNFVNDAIELIRVDLSAIFKECTLKGRAAVVLLAPFVVLVWLVVAVALFLPPLIYRWTIKATAVLYLPLIWAVGSAYRHLPDIRVALQRIRASEMAQCGRMIATLVILGLAAKVFLMAVWPGFATWWNGIPLLGVIEIYVRPKDIPVWQVASFLNGTMAFGLYWFAAEALERYDHPDAWPDRRIEGVIRSTSFIRTLLTCYTIVCSIYLTFASALDFPIPGLGTRVFPWL